MGADASGSARPTVGRNEIRTTGREAGKLMAIG